MKENSFKERQLNEALLRMGLLKLDKHCINALKKGEIWESEGNGALYELNDDEKKIVKDFYQKNPNTLIYHLIHNRFEFGNCYSILYVGSDEVEWETDKEDIQFGYVFSYVKNVDYEDCSEFGTIYVKPNIGGLIRLS